MPACLILPANVTALLGHYGQFVLHFLVKSMLNMLLNCKNRRLRHMTCFKCGTFSILRDVVVYLEHV